MPNRRRAVRIALATAATLLLLGGSAFGCSLAFREAGPVQQSDVRLPIRHENLRASWGLQSGWVSIRPGVSRPVRVTGRSELLFGVVHRKQRTFDLLGDNPRGNLAFRDDGDPATPACELVGRAVWTQPKLLTRQTSRAVFVTFATRPIGGDRTGCSIGQASVINSCAELAFGSVTLDAPLGERNFVRTFFTG